MGVKFTDEQRKAIETLDKSVLVSAAAGSGKTAVLVQRIINIILNGQANVDEMLVVTFTKAAASEMRLKLTRAIKKKMQEDPSSKAKLRDQLNRMYRAYISTFDSFAVRVIKEFFYEIDIEPDFIACDDVQSELMKRDAVDNLIEEAFANDNLIEVGSFREFMRLYSAERNEDTFKTDLMATYSKLRSMPNYWKWAFDSAEQMELGRDGFGRSEAGQAALVDIAEETAIAKAALIQVRQLYEDAGLEEKFYQMLGTEAEVIELLEEKGEDAFLDIEVEEKLNNLDWVNLQKYTVFFAPKTEDDLKKIYASFRTQITPLRNIYKSAIEGIRNRYFSPDVDTRIKEMNATYDYTIYYLNLMKAFEERYQALKNQSHMLDFADMEHVAVSILEKKIPQDTLRNRFKFIFIDEYQDTNNIQEYLIGCFARNDNVFKVGDVKQSIYRFRQAEPAIFERVYNQYSDDYNTVATAIDLNKNFRSNDATIAYINEVFKDVMPGYDAAAQLYTGLDKGKGYQDEYDFKPEVHILSKEMGAEDADEEVAADEQIESISAEDAEAKYIADLIEQTIGTEFYDSASGTVRPIEARDIAVLYRSIKVRGESLTRMLASRNILAHVEESDNYFDTVEIGVALSLFACIDNMKRDVPLIATLHSDVFGWSPDDLAQIRIEYRQNNINEKDPYWKALQWYREKGSNDELRARTAEVYRKIGEWRELSVVLPIEDFIWKVLVDSGYYLHAGAMYDGDRRQANLRVLVDRARQYSGETVASLSSFLRFIEIMKTRDVKNGQASMVSKDDNVVRITTIHKSKGLEYPVVIVGGLGHAFNKEKNEKRLSFDSRIGVGLHYVSPDRRYWRSTILQRAINAASNKEEYKEELRILYVAMTRARNKLVLVGTINKEDSIDAYTPHPNTYLKVMRNVLETDYNEYNLVPLGMTEKVSGQTRIGNLLKTRREPSEIMSSEMYGEIIRRLEYVYPNEDLLTTKAKYSVSALRREELTTEAALQADDEVIHLWKLGDKERKSGAADIGVAYHRIMEFVDFTQASSDYIDKRAQQLRDSGSIESDVFDKLNMAVINNFFESELGKRAIAAAKQGKLKKEKAFTLATDWKEKSIMVQGVIDCCWEENGKMILVDYKSSYINPYKPQKEEIERIKREYKTQVKLYAEALEQGTGKEVSEAYLYLFEIDEAVRVI